MATNRERKLTDDENKESKEAEYWENIEKKGFVNVTEQKNMLCYRADVLHKKKNYDVIMLYHSFNEQSNTPRHIFDFYATPGSARDFMFIDTAAGCTAGKIVMKAFKSFFKAKFTSQTQRAPTKSTATPAMQDTCTTTATPAMQDTCTTTATPAPTKSTATPATTNSTANISTSESFPCRHVAPSSTTAKLDTQGKLVAFRDDAGSVLALGFHHSSQRILHGMVIPSHSDVVLIQHLMKQSIPSPIVIGDPDENQFLATGQFFALPRKNLAVVKMVSKQIGQLS